MKWRRVEEWLILVMLLALPITSVAMIVFSGYGDTPTISRIDTVAVEQRLANDRIAKVQATANDALALCGYARSAAAMADAKAGWLRERLEILYRRQGRMPRRLSQWPGGDVPAMEAIR